MKSSGKIIENLTFIGEEWVFKVHVGANRKYNLWYSYSLTDIETLN